MHRGADDIAIDIELTMYTVFGAAHFPDIVSTIVFPCIDISSNSISSVSLEKRVNEGKATRMKLKNKTLSIGIIDGKKKTNKKIQSKILWINEIFHVRNENSWTIDRLLIRNRRESGKKISDRD